jgi:glucose/arabinose dehydrogenase
MPRSLNATMHVVAAVLAAAVTAGACHGSQPTTPPGPQAQPALQLLASGLSQPLYVAAAPGDTARLFVVLQTGQIRIIRHDTLLPAPFLDVTSLVSCCGERGLLSLAFHPQYAQNGLFFIDYTDVNGTTRVARYHVAANPDSADDASATPVLSQAQPFANHNGGLLLFGPDGYLYVGLGDGGSGGDPQGNGQSLNTQLGKILRIDVNGAPPYAIPPGNPFAGTAGAKPEIWAYGLRNPWRFAFDRQTGDLYIADVGQGAREEVDFQPAASQGGENYGWNVMEGLACYNASTCNQTGLTLPVLDYAHDQGCAIVGGYVYRGTRLPILSGWYLYSDNCTDFVRSLKVANGVVVEQHDWSSVLQPSQGVTSFGEDARGELYITTGSGNVYRIVPAPS